MSKQLLSINEAAAKLGVSAKTLRRWENRGLISPQRTIGNQRRYALSDIETLKIKGSRPLLVPVKNKQLEEKERFFDIASIKAPQLTPIIRNVDAEPKSHQITPALITPKLNNHSSFLSRTPVRLGLTFFGLLGIALILGSLSQYVKPAHLIALLPHLNTTKSITVHPDDQVLAAATQKHNFGLKINVPVEFMDTASVAGTLTAPNILYNVLPGNNITISGDPQKPIISAIGGVTSLQGQSGAVALTAGTGISISGLTINSTVASSNSFANIKVGSSTITAGGSTDTLEFVAGSNISLSADTSNKKLTINGASVTPSGWTDSGTIVSLTTITDNVGIGTAAPAASLDVEGTLKVSGTTNFNSLTYTWPTTQTNAYILQTNGSGALSWIDPGSLPNSDKWDSILGAITPKIESQDLLIGGQASSSAKFAVLNINSGTPTASLSAGLAGGAYLTADGTLQTTANQNLNLGGSSTGNINLSPKNGGGTLNLNIGALTVNGNTGSTSVTPTCVSITQGIVTGTGNCGPGQGGSIWTLATSTGVIYPMNNTMDVLIGGIATSSARFAALNINSGNPTASLSAGVTGATYLTSAGLLQTTNNQTLTLGGNTTGNITLSPLNGTGDTKFNGTTTLGGLTYTWPSSGQSSGFALVTNGSGTLSWADLGASVSNYWRQINGALYPANSTVDLLIGGVATSSASFHVFGASLFQGTNPVASIAANTSFAGFAIDNQGKGDLFTASSSGLNRFVIKQNGNVGIGTTIPTAMLHIDADGPSGNFNNAGIEVNAILNTPLISTNSAVAKQVLNNNFPSQDVSLMGNYQGITSPGFLVGQLSANTFGFAGFTNNTYDSYVGNIHSNWAAYDVSVNRPTGEYIHFDTNNNRIDINAWGSHNIARFDASTTLGALFTLDSNETFTGGALANLDVRGKASVFSSIPVASISGRTGMAALLVDNTGVGDLFTASSSGRNRFVIKQNGNVGIGTTLPSALFQINQPFSNTTAFLINATAATFGDPHLFTIKDETTTERIGYDNLIHQTTIGGGIKGIWDSAALVAWTDDAAATALRIGGAASSAQTGNLLEVYASFDNTTAAKSDLKFAINPSGTISTASISANTSFAGLVVDNKGTGDLFTASSSGLNRFVIKQNGNVGIGVATPSAQLFVGGNTNPATVGTYIDTGIVYSPNSVAVRGRYAYVVGTDSGNHTQLKILDITDPTRPASVGATPIFNKSGALANNTKRIFVAGNYAYTVNQGGGSTGFEITDITNPAAPLLVNSSTDIPSAATPQDVVIRGRYAYIAGNGNDTLYVVDISNPQAPVTAGSISTVAVNATAHNPNRVVVIGDYAYVTNANSANSFMQVFDISNPSVPTYVGKVTTSSNARSIAASGFGKYLFVTTDAEMETIDIGNPATPTIVGTGNFNLGSGSGSGAVETVLAGRDLYILSPSNDVMQIWDVSNPSAPVKISGNISLGTGSSPVAIALQGRYAFIAANGTQKLLSVNVDGAYLQQLEAGAIETNGGLTVGGMFQGVDGYMTGGLTVGNGLDITGGSRLFGTTSLLDSQSATAAAMIQNTDTGTNADGLAIKLGFTGSTGGTTTCNNGGACNEFITFLNGNGLKLGKILAATTTTITYKGNGSDYAELFKADTSLLPSNYTSADLNTVFPEGMMVCQGANGAIPCTASDHNKIIGPISTAPSFVGGADGPDKVTVALSGQVPVMMSTENGVIHSGDLLTLSATTSGAVMKASKAGAIVGKALEDYSAQEIGKAKMYISLTWYDPDVYLTNIGNINVFEKPHAPQIDDTSLFDIKDESGQNVQRVGVFSDAVVGNLKSGSINVQSLTLGGTNVNDKLIGLEGGIASLSANFVNPIASFQTQVLSLSDRVASLEAKLTASNSALFTNNPTGFTASSGAELNLDKLNVSGSIISDKLSVISYATVNDLSVNGTLTAGLLQIKGLDNGGSSISTLNGDLKLQNQGYGGIDILNGKITIDTQGNITTNSEITAKKFNVDTTDVSAASAGSGTILSGTKSTTINSTAITTNSIIQVTFTNDYSPATRYWIKTKTEGVSFTVGLDQPVTANTKFNWWIIN